jgi:hypothetical protein
MNQEDLALSEQGLAEWVNWLDATEHSWSEEKSGGQNSAPIGLANRLGGGPS